MYLISHYSCTFELFGISHFSQSFNAFHGHVIVQCAPTILRALVGQNRVLPINLFMKKIRANSAQYTGISVWRTVEKVDKSRAKLPTQTYYAEMETCRAFNDVKPSPVKCYSLTVHAIITPHINQFTIIVLSEENKQILKMYRR